MEALGSKGVPRLLGAGVFFLLFWQVEPKEVAKVFWYPWTACKKRERSEEREN